MFLSCDPYGIFKRYCKGFGNYSYLHQQILKTNFELMIYLITNTGDRLAWAGKDLFTIRKIFSMHLSSYANRMLQISWDTTIADILTHRDILTRLALWPLFKFHTLSLDTSIMIHTNEESAGWQADHVQRLLRWFHLWRQKLPWQFLFLFWWLLRQFQYFILRLLIFFFTKKHFPDWNIATAWL